MESTPKRFNFVKKAINDLPAPDKGLVYYWDTQTRGLYLIITPAGVKSFYVRRKVKDKSERLFLGRFPELTIDQARSKAAEFHSALSNNKNLAQVRRSEFSEPTLGNLFMEYLERHAKKSRRTWQAMQEEFERSFSDWRNRKLSAITSEDVERKHAEIGKKRGEYVANRAMELLRAIYNKGIQWKICSCANPASNLTLFPERPRIRILQKDEFQRFITAVNNEPDQRFKDFIMLCLLTGARKTNVLTMRWQDIDLKEATWTVSSEQSKNGQPFVIALTEPELKILRLREKAKDGPYVFPGKGVNGHFVEPNRAWARLIKRAEIQDLHIHDLRRSMASWMANTGANVSLIQSALNHKDIKTTLTVYAHTVKDAERDARQKAHNFILKRNATRSKR